MGKLKKNKRLTNELATSPVPQNIEDSRLTQLRCPYNVRRREESRSND